LPDSHLV